VPASLPKAILTGTINLPAYKDARHTPFIERRGG
jgi:hypothetical protein